MSKRKHRSRSDTRREVTGQNRNNANTNNTNVNNNANNNNNNRQAYNNGPFGINPNQLLSSMFGNIDMNQINSMLQSMNTQGFDFNNLNLGNLQNLMGNMGGMGSAVNQGAHNRETTKKEEEGESENKSINFNDENNIKDNIERNDENIQMLRAIRSIVGGERATFIDRVISMYNDGAFDE